MTINEAKYYESNTATASDAHGDLIRNPETVNCTINGNETVNHTSNDNFEQKILSNRNIPVVIPMMNPRIVPIVLAPQMILTPATKEVATDAASCGAWVNRTPRQVSRTGVDGSTPGDICHDVRIVEPNSTLLIGIVTTPPPCGLNASQKVTNKWQPTSPALVGNTKNSTLSLI